MGRKKKIPACKHCGSTEWNATEHVRETENRWKMIDGVLTVVEEGEPDSYFNYYCAGCGQEGVDKVHESLERF